YAAKADLVIALSRVILKILYNLPSTSPSRPGCRPGPAADAGVLGFRLLGFSYFGLKILYNVAAEEDEEWVVYCVAIFLDEFL
ncbi:unnamed protein product, partial [Amoebophrya sp. A120]